MLGFEGHGRVWNACDRNVSVIFSVHMPRGNERFKERFANEILKDRSNRQIIFLDYVGLTAFCDGDERL